MNDKNLPKTKLSVGHKKPKSGKPEINKGFRGIWERLTVKRSQMVKQNEAEAYTAHMLNREQKDEFSFNL